MSLGGQSLTWPGGEARRTATIVCSTTCLVYSLSGEIFQSLLAKYPEERLYVDKELHPKHSCCPARAGRVYVSFVAALEYFRSLPAIRCS